MMISNVEDYFSKGCGRCSKFDTDACSTTVWSEGLAMLREICRSAGLQETAKWGHPCYMYADRNIVIIGAFKDDFRLSFFNPSLMKDAANLLEKQGPNTQHPNMFRFTSNNIPDPLQQTILAYMEEAKGYAEKGIKPEKKQSELSAPDELTEALDADPELSEAFHKLTPGRQRSYVLNLNGAKKSETRISRIEKFRTKIFEGKGVNER